MGRGRNCEVNLVGRLRWHLKRLRRCSVAPHLVVKEVGQVQFNRRFAHSLLGRRQSEVKCQRLAPGKHVTRLVGGDAQFDGLPLGESHVSVAWRELHGIEPNGRPLGRTGVVFGLPQIGAGQDVAGLGRRRNIERVALPLRGEFHELFDGGGVELAHDQPRRGARDGSFHGDRERVGLARLDGDPADAGRQRGPDRPAHHVQIIVVRDRLILGPKRDLQARVAVRRGARIKMAEQPIERTVPAGQGVQFGRSPTVRAALEAGVGHEVLLIFTEKRDDPAGVKCRRLRRETRRAGRQQHG